MKSLKLRIKIKKLLKPTKGKVFLTLFLFLLIFFGSRLFCPADPGFYLDPSPYFDPSPRLQLCQYLYGINWITTILVLYLISSMVIHLLRGRKINGESKS